MKGIRFVTGEQALTIGKTLVVADMHIGIEHKYRKQGISIPSQSERLVRRIGELIERTGAERLVVLGDVKYQVPGTSFQEEREVPAIFRGLLEKVKMDVAPGNHDGGIEKLLPPGVELHPSGGFMLGKTWLCHGHAWPPEEFLGAEQVVIGHNHAGIELRDKLGYRWTLPVWVKAGLDREKLAARYKDAGENLPEIVLMPPFNEFSGFIALNKKVEEYDRYFGEGPSPIFRAAKRDEARIYMMDGTFLGELGRL
jgi:putative SbcD/Mre11-related phosphoesterase